MRRIQIWFVFLLVLIGNTSLSRSPAQSVEDAPTIAFASFATIKTHIFIADTDGNNAKPLLASQDMDYNPSFSRDGAWIVFTSNRGGSADIYRVRADGSGTERLTDDRAFDDQGVLSPDGKSLAFVSTRGGRANIWLLDMKSRKLKNLTPNSSGDFRPAWSPDGQWITFSSDRDSTHPKFLFATLQSTEIYVMKRDGSEVRRISHESAMAGSPSWSPDGARIVFYLASIEEGTKIGSPTRLHGDMQLVSVDWKTGERRVLTNTPGEKRSPRWLSPSRIAYVSGGPSGGIERTDGAAGARGEFWNASWSADGRAMVFHRETDSSWPPFEPWPSRDPGFQLLRTGIFPSFSPSGDQLVCNSGTAGIVHNSILLIDVRNSNRSVLFDDPQRSALAPAWSPKGDQIAFALGGFFQMAVGKLQGVTAATSQLAIIRSDGSGMRLLTAAGDHVGFPSWSPDGRKLVYRVGDKAGKGLRIIDLDANRVTEVTSGSQNDNFPAWSPIGDRIVFTTDRDGDYEIYTIRPDGTDLQRLTRSPGNDAHPAWSPDGKWIAFASTRSGHKDESLLHPYNPQPDGEIFVMRADGSDVRQLTENQFEDATPAWKPSHAARKKADN